MPTINRPSCVVHIRDLPGEKRPRFTATAGVASIVRTLGDATGLTRMGVNLRTVDPGHAGTNRHFHTVEEEWTYVVAGRGTVRIGPHRLPVEPGCFVGFPPGPRPHHFIAEGNETLVLLEGGERRPSEDAGWYPDARKMGRGGAVVEPYEEPPPEEGDRSQCLRVAEVPVVDFRHDVDPSARRRMRRLHGPTGLRRQAVCWAQVATGARSTAFHTHDRTEEWIFVLAGSAIARVGEDRFAIGPNDFLGHPAGGPAHLMEALDELTYLVGGQIDVDDIVTYPEAALQRVGGRLQPLPATGSNGLG
jgi:uncharacterized cupin superfamily protein